MFVRNCVLSTFKRKQQLLPLTSSEFPFPNQVFFNIVDIHNNATHFKIAKSWLLFDLINHHSFMFYFKAISCYTIHSFVIHCKKKIFASSRMNHMFRTFFGNFSIKYISNCVAHHTPLKLWEK